MKWLEGVAFSNSTVIFMKPLSAILVRYACYAHSR